MRSTLISMLLGGLLAACSAPAAPPDVGPAVAATAEPAPSIAPSPSVAPPPPPAPPPPRPKLPRQRLSERAVSVAIVDAIAVARDAHGNTARLSSGPDIAASLSPDGMTVAFVRKIDDYARDLYRVRVDAGEPELLVADGPLTPPGGVDMTLIRAPLFSLDGKRVFFMVQNGRLGAICGVDVDTRKVQWIATAIEAELLRKGPYRGHFLIAHRSDSPSGGFVERCEVWDSNKGKLIHSVACGEGANLTDPGARRALGLDPQDPTRAPFGLK